ncbi:MAG: S1C family serine protease [Acidimicrobiia bacterium]
MRMRMYWLTVVIAVGVFGAACGSSTGGDTTSSSVPTTIPKSTTTATTTTVPGTTSTVPSLVVEDLVDARNAIIRVVSDGSFVDPPNLEISPAGIGTGFLIAEDGLAVTTGRAVIGAESIAVHVGDATEPVSATVISYDECANLALIDIDGDGFRYLEFAAGPALAGTNVYVPEIRPNGTFAIREGIVTDEDPGGFASWARVTAFIEHTAAASVGSAGAPLLSEDVQVLGVNHIGDTLDRYFAIPSDYARALTKAGTGPGIGLNGVAVKNSSYNGTWVAQVMPGSPAADVGIRPGDVVTFLGDAEMAPSGGRGAYCATVSDEAFAESSPIKAFRTTPPQHYVGILASGEVMAREFVIARDLAYHLAPSQEAAYDYTLIANDDGTLEVEVPTAWGDTNWGRWVRGPEERVVGTSLRAAPDWDAWHDGWATPGIFVGSSPVLAEEYDGYAFLDDYSFDHCTYDIRGATASDEPSVIDVWYDCGEEDAVFVVVMPRKGPRDPVMIMEMVLVDQRDLDALLKAIATVNWVIPE